MFVGRREERGREKTDCRDVHMVRFWKYLENQYGDED